MIDGAKTVGTRFLLIHYINDEKPEKGINIIHSGSGLLPEDKDYSAVEREAIALDSAISACHHWIYYCKSIELISDREGLLGLMDKHLVDVDNKKLQKILQTASNYKWELKHVKGNENEICNALSRLCTKVCLDSHKYVVWSPTSLQMSKKASIRNKQMEKEDHLMMKISKEANMDLDTIEMMNHIKNDTEFEQIPSESEL